MIAAPTADVTDAHVVVEDNNRAGKKDALASAFPLVWGQKSTKKKTDRQLASIVIDVTIAIGKILQEKRMCCQFGNAPSAWFEA